MKETGDTQREAAALAETLATQADNATPQQENLIPVHVVQALREELKSAKEQNEVFKNHFNMMQWQQKPQEAVDPFQGIDPEDSIKAKDAFKLYQDLNRKFESRLAEVKITQKAPDYGEMIRKYLPLASQEDPELLQDIQASSNPYKTAYNAIKASKAYQEDYLKDKMKEPVKSNPYAEKVVANARQSGSVASIPSQSSHTGSYPSFSQMTEDEFREFKSGVKLRKAGAQK